MTALRIFRIEAALGSRSHFAPGGRTLSTYAKSSESAR